MPEEIGVEGFSPIRAELYLLPEGDESELRVSVSSLGTLVYDDICDFEAGDFRGPPWTNRRLSGLIEFRDFQVPPGSRRGVLPDAAAHAFAAALRIFERQVLARLQEIQAEVAAAVEAGLVRQLERAFRDLPRLAPEYDFFGVQARSETPSSASLPDGAGVAAEANAGEPLLSPEPLEPAEEPTAADEQPSLLPAGPLAQLQIRPAQVRLERFGTKALHAVARDAAGVLIERDLLLRWGSEPSLATLTETGPRTAEVRAGGDTGTASVYAVATEGREEVSAQARLVVVEDLETPGARAGIPEPAFLHEPYGEWRSRMNDGRWEVNSGHPDFRQAAETPRRKLRYIASLLAKEVVLHSFPVPQLGPSLERLVSVLAMAERRIERS